MKVSFDPLKNERNIRERGLSFLRAGDFDFESAITMPELRNGELRWVSVGYLDKRLHVLVFVETEDGIRVVSFRKANRRAGAKYGKPTTIAG